MNLSEFLLARIAEDEERVRLWDGDGKARVASMWTGPEPGYTTVASDHADGHWVADGHEVDSPRRARVLWDPARALAECEAKRRIVGLHQATGLVDHSQVECTCGFEDHRSRWCAGCGVRVYDEGEFQRPYGPCPTLRLLALPYADHPDYQQEWRP